MIYRCQNCDSALEFDPVSGMMQCLHCGSFFEMSQFADVDVAEKSDAESSSVINSLEDDATMEVKIYTCTSCGAELAVNDTEVSTWCAFCGQPTVVYSRVSNEQRPKYILPFKVTHEEALNAIRKQFSRGIFTPKEVKNFEVDKMRGIYVPYYLCDVYYNDLQELYVKTDGKKKIEETFEVLAECSFNQITCDAATRLNDNLSKRLEPYRLEDLRKFETAYLSGFYADKKDLTDEELQVVLKGRCKELFDSQIRRIFHNPQFVKRDPRMKVKKTEYALLPVWFMTFRYDNKPHTILVNGQNAKVVGALPVRKWRLILFGGAVVLLASLIFGGLLLFVFWHLLFIFPISIHIPFVLTVATAIRLQVVGIKRIMKYTKNMKLMKLNMTYNYVKERQEGGHK